MLLNKLFGAAIKNARVGKYAVSLAALSIALSPMSAAGASLSEAVRTALETNPQIGQAVANREATEFELKQALGLYAPQLDLEASAGIQRYDSPSRRAAGIEDEPLYTSGVGLVASYSILDGGFRAAETDKQAARIDSASFRVLEQSELVGLEIARLYFELILQQRIVDLNRANVSFHDQALSDVSEALSNGQLTEADRQQATERLASAHASLVSAVEALASAKISYEKNVGTAFSGVTMPPRMGNYLPNAEQRLIDIALANNPRVNGAAADVDIAAALVEQTKGAFGPSLDLEGRVGVDNDTGGTEGVVTSVQGRLVMRWKLFDGGIRAARVQETVRRETEAMFAQQEAGRDVIEAVRVSRERITRQGALAADYQRQLSVSSELVNSYQDQFTVGQRTLLDLLDAQNGRFNAQVLAATAEFSMRYAEYRLLASTGSLLSFLNVQAPEQSLIYAREMMGTPSASEFQPRETKDVGFTTTN